MSIARWLAWSSSEARIHSTTDTRGTDKAARRVKETPSGGSGSAFRTEPAAILSLADEHEDESRWPHRIVIDESRPAAVPVRLNAWTTVVDPTRAIEADLGSLAVAVRAYSSACGDRDRQGEAEEITSRIEEVIDRLERCGCRVRVVALQ